MEGLLSFLVCSLVNLSFLTSECAVHAQGPGTPGSRLVSGPGPVCTKPNMRETLLFLKTTQVASMHPTKALPPAHPQHPLQTTKTCSPGRQRCLLEGHEHRKFGRCSHWPQMLRVLSRPAAGAPPLACSRKCVHTASWVCQKTPVGPKSSSVSRRCGCYPKPPGSQEQLPSSCLFARLLGRRKQILAKVLLFWTRLYSDRKI